MDEAETGQEEDEEARMNSYEREQVIEANRQPSPPARPRPARDEINVARHAEREGEYERVSVLSALKAVESKYNGVKPWPTQ